MIDGSATRSGETTIEALDGSDLLRSSRGEEPRGLEPGEIVDELYRVEDLVGSGAMGVVYRARDLELDRVVALKLQRASDERATARLLREARAMAKLSHPNVITVHAVGVVGDQVYIAMEFVDGGTLRTWLRAEERSVDAILDAFAQAGRGLSAAHAEGLVHRDFKPDNVLVGSDGRVRVADFGLVRGRGEVDGPLPETSPRLQSLSGSSVDIRLTETGTMAGTPAYMAPEQYWRGSIDERADQFAFCVALYEALYGEHPFAGKTPSELLSKIMDGEIRSVPARSRVPARVRRPLLRGLSPSPEARFPSMRALLARLRLDGGRRRRVTLVAVGVAASIAGAGATVILSQDEAIASPCVDAAAAIDDVWTADVRSARAAAYHESGHAFADDVWSGAEQRLDAYVGQWRGQRVDACEDTRVRGEASDLMLERRYACLDRTSLALRSLLDALERPNARVVRDTLDAVDGLPSLARCDDPEYLAAEVEPPPPQLAARVAEVRAHVAAASAAFRLGDFETATRERDEARRLVGGLDHLPVQVEVGLLDGTLIERLDSDAKAATVMLRTTYFDARKVRHHQIASDAARLLGYTTGYVDQRHDEGALWLSLAETELELRGGAEPADLIAIIHMRCAIAISRGEYERGVVMARKASDLAEGGSPQLIASTRLRLAAALDEQGEFDEAAQHYEAGIAHLEAERGPHDPGLINALSNFSLNAQDRGDLAGAEALVRRAKAIAIAVHGEGHYEVADVALNLGVILQNMGKADEAAGEYEEALAGFKAARGEEHPSVALVLNNLGMLAADRGELELALSRGREAVARARASQGEEHPDVALFRFNVGNTLFDLEHYEDALAELTTACAGFSGSLGDEHFRTHECRAVGGQVRSELGEHGPALETQEAALARLIELDAPATIVANVRLGLARSLAAAGRDRSRPRALAQTALEYFERAGIEHRASRARRVLSEIG